MNDFKKFGGKGKGFERRDGGRPSFGGKPGFKKFGDRGSDRPHTMHKAVCAECNKGCEVPFKPTGDKPVYCSNCFGNKREGGSNTFDARGPKREFRDAPRPFVKTEREESRPDRRIDDLKMQMDTLNSKIDRLFDVVKTLAQAQAPKKEVVVAVAEKVIAKPVAKLVAPKVAPKAPAKVSVKTATKAVKVVKKAAPKVVAKKGGSKKK